MKTLSVLFSFLIPALAQCAALSRSCEILLMKAAVKDAEQARGWVELHYPKSELDAIRAGIGRANEWDGVVYDVNMAKELLRREKLGDQHVKWLRYLGVTISGRRGATPKVRFSTQPEFILARANAYTQQLIRSGQIKEEQAIQLAVLYVKKDVLEKKLINEYEFEDLYFVRPGVDSPPPADRFVELGTLPQFAHPTWERIMADGYLPMPLGVTTMLFHDLAHVTDLLANPRLMAATRSYYRWAVQQPQGWRTRITQPFAQSSEFPNAAYSPENIAHSTRMLVATEALNLVTENGKELVRSALPEFFGANRPKNWTEQAKKLEVLNEAELVARAATTHSLAHRAASRHGGSMRDPYNLERDLPQIWQSIERSILRGEPYQNRPSDGESLTLPVLKESLLGMIELAKRTATLLTERKDLSVEQRSRAANYLREFLAQTETGLAYAVIHELRPEDFFYDLRSRVANPHSKSARYVETFARPDGLLWQAYRSEGAQGTYAQTSSSFLLQLAEANARLQFVPAIGGGGAFYQRASNHPRGPVEYSFKLEGGEFLDVRPFSSEFRSVRELLGKDRAPLTEVLNALGIDYSAIRKPQ